MTIRKSIPRTLLDQAQRLEGAHTVDVREQTPDVVRFYETRGFGVVGRSEMDSAGRPFPLLHLREGSAKKWVGIGRASTTRPDLPHTVPSPGLPHKDSACEQCRCKRV